VSVNSCLQYKGTTLSNWIRWVIVWYDNILESWHFGALSEVWKFHQGRKISPRMHFSWPRRSKFNQFQLFYLLVWDNFPFFVLCEISKLRGNCVFLYSLLCIHILYERTSVFFLKKKRKIEKGKKHEYDLID